MAKKILLVEDEADVVKVLMKRLIDSGFEADFRSDAIGAHQCAMQTKPDLILLDMMLPAGGGLAVLQNLQRSGKTMGIPVIAVSGMQNEKIKKQVMDLGVKAFVQKPYEFDHLLIEIKKALNMPLGE